MVNLSQQTFRIPEYNLLSKNLNFCPNPGNYNKNQLKKDTTDFTRRIKLKSFFYEPDEPTETTLNQQEEFFT